MNAFRLYVYRGASGQMSGQVYADAEPYFGIGGCSDRNGVIDAAKEQIGTAADLEIVYDRPPEARAR